MLQKLKQSQSMSHLNRLDLCMQVLKWSGLGVFVACVHMLYTANAQQWWCISITCSCPGPQYTVTLYLHAAKSIQWVLAQGFRHRLHHLIMPCSVPKTLLHITHGTTAQGTSHSGPQQAYFDQGSNHLCALQSRGCDCCRATADSDEGVPLGGLAKLGSNVADLMTSQLQRPSVNQDRLAAILGSSAGQLLTPASTNAKTSPESPPAGSSETTSSPADVRLTVSPKVSPRKKGGAGLKKGGSLTALLDIAESEGSVASSSAGLLQAGGATSSPPPDNRYLLDNHTYFRSCPALHADPWHPNALMSDLTTVVTVTCNLRIRVADPRWRHVSPG